MKFNSRHRARGWQTRHEFTFVAWRRGVRWCRACARKCSPNNFPFFMQPIFDGQPAILKTFSPSFDGNRGGSKGRDSRITVGRAGARGRASVWTRIGTKASVLITRPAGVSRYRKYRGYRLHIPMYPPAGTLRHAILAIASVGLSPCHPVHVIWKY